MIYEHFSDHLFSPLQALKEFLKVLFLDHVKYRDLVLQSLSLVDASLPELHLMSVDLITVFLRNVGSSPPEGEHSMSISIVSPAGTGTGAAHVQFTVEGATHHSTLSKKVRSRTFYCGGHHIQCIILPWQFTIIIHCICTLCT